MKRHILTLLIVLGSMGLYINNVSASCSGTFDADGFCVIDGVGGADSSSSTSAASPSATTSTPASQNTANSTSTNSNPAPTPGVQAERDRQQNSGMYSNQNGTPGTPSSTTNGETGVGGDADGATGNTSENSEGETGVGGNAATPANGASSGSGGKAITVTVTEKIPGAKCEPIGNGNGPGGKKYKCTVESGFSTIQSMLGGLIKYVTFLTALIGMLMVVFSGFQYATSAGDGDSQKKAVIRIQKLIGGLILLFLTGFILNTIAPWIYK